MINNKGLYIPIKLLAFFSLFSFLFPVFKIGGFGMKLDLLLLFPLTILILLIDTHIKKQSLLSKIFIIAFLIFLSMFVSNTLGMNYYGNSKGLSIPTEYSSFISKILILYVFYFIGQCNIITYKVFLRLITIIFIVALFFGLFQYLGLPFSDRLTDLYATTENQVRKISTGSIRVFSVTGNVLTWAGWSGFIFVFSIFVYKNQLLKWLMLILSSSNLLFSSSRGALIAVGATLLLYMLYKAYRKRDLRFLIKSLFISSLIVIILVFISLHFFENRVLFFIERFHFLNEAVFESGRNIQLQKVSHVFNTDILNYLFGIGKPIIDSIGLMEVEPLFLLFAYGIIGISLHYSFIFIILKKSSKAISSVFSDVLIFGILYFLIYSFGYFFLREIYSGLLFWSIIGYFLSQLDYAK